jgi:hypothetical protein
LATLAFAGLATADVLVLNDGSRVETEGPWEVRGQLVVFHLPKGALSSVRLDSVDLEASREATEEAARPKEAPKEIAVKAPVAVLTDSDVGHVRDENLPSPDTILNTPAEEAETEIPAGEDEVAGGGLRVTTWEEEIPDHGGVLIRGELTNASSALTTGVRVTVVLLDSAGEVLGSQEARVERQTLKPGVSTSFSADLPGVISFTEARFDIGGIPLQYSSEPGTPDSDQPES